MLQALRLFPFAETGASLGHFDAAQRVGFEPTVLLPVHLISSVVPRTDFSGSWAKIAPLIGSPGEPSNPLVSRQSYPQSRINQGKFELPASALKMASKTEKRREFGENGEKSGEKYTDLLLLAKKEERCMAWTQRPNIKTY